MKLKNFFNRKSNKNDTDQIENKNIDTDQIEKPKIDKDYFGDYISSMKDPKDLLSGDLDIFKFPRSSDYDRYRDLKESLRELNSAKRQLDLCVKGYSQYNLKDLGIESSTVYYQLNSFIEKRNPKLADGLDKDYALNIGVPSRLNAHLKSEYKRMDQYVSSLSDKSNLLTGKAELLPNCLKGIQEETDRLKREWESGVYEVDGSTIERWYKDSLEKYSQMMYCTYENYNIIKNKYTEITNGFSEKDKIDSGVKENALDESINFLEKIRVKTGEYYREKNAILHDPIDYLKSEYERMDQYVSSLSNKSNPFTGKDELLPNCLKGIKEETDRLKRESSVYEVDGRTEELYKKTLEKYSQMMYYTYENYNIIKNKYTEIANGFSEKDKIDSGVKDIALTESINFLKEFRAKTGEYYSEKNAVLLEPEEKYAPEIEQKTGRSINKGIQENTLRDKEENSMRYYLYTLIDKNNILSGNFDYLPKSLDKIHSKWDRLNHECDEYRYRLGKEGLDELKEKLDKTQKVFYKAINDEYNKYMAKQNNNQTIDNIEGMKQKEKPVNESVEQQPSREKRAPQLITVNGDAITHAHVFKSNTSDDWFFTAKINGVPLKPQKVSNEDMEAVVVNKSKKPHELMETYYPTKMMAKISAEEFKKPFSVNTPDGEKPVYKFNVYKVEDKNNLYYGKYRFYAQVGDLKMSENASKKDLDAYFDRVVTPADLVKKVFGERLHLQEYYKMFTLPENADIAAKDIRMMKNAVTNKYEISVNLGDHGRTSAKEISYDDRQSYFSHKTASKEQLAAKYLGPEISDMLKSVPKQEREKQYSMNR